MREALDICVNVRIRAYTRVGSCERLIDTHVGHNIFTKVGREWLADAARVTAGGARKGTTIPFYLALGKGSQTEDQNVKYLNDPVQVTAGNYLVALDKPTSEPISTTNRYTKTLDYTDVSYAGAVSLTEFGIITSNAVTTLPGGYKAAAGGPYPGTYDNGSLLAFRLTPVISKTALIKLELEWDFVF